MLCFMTIVSNFLHMHIVYFNYRRKRERAAKILFTEAARIFLLVIVLCTRAPALETQRMLHNSCN